MSSVVLRHTCGNFLGDDSSDLVGVVPFDVAEQVVELLDDVRQPVQVRLAAAAALLRDTSDSRADGIVDAVNDGTLSRLDGTKLAIGMLAELDNIAGARNVK